MLQTSLAFLCFALFLHVCPFFFLFSELIWENRGGEATRKWASHFFEETHMASFFRLVSFKTHQKGTLTTEDTQIELWPKLSVCAFLPDTWVLVTIGGTPMGWFSQTKFIAFGVGRVAQSIRGHGRALGRGPRHRRGHRPFREPHRREARLSHGTRFLPRGEQGLGNPDQ